MGQVRIIGGEHRSRILRFKDKVTDLRPTPDRVRETVFNWLGQRLNGKICLDLFAGSGAFGFEAASRGAKEIVMIEANRNIYNDLLTNTRLLKANNIRAYNQNAIDYITQATQTFDIIFIDPPYTTTLLQQCLTILADSKLLNVNALVYIEYKNMPDLAGYTVLKQSRAGIVHFALLKKE